MATGTGSSFLMLSHGATYSMHSQYFSPSLRCAIPKPLVRGFCPDPLALKPKETMRVVNMNLRREAMSWPDDGILGAFSTEDGEVADNKEVKEQGVEGGDESTTDAIATPKAKKGNSLWPTKKERRRIPRFTDIRILREVKREYDLKTAISLLKETTNTKVVDTVEAHLHLNIRPKHDNQKLSAIVTLPKWTGNTVQIVVITVGEKFVEAKNAGADFVGGENLIEQIKGGFMEFDKVIASPDMMPKLASIEAILGPRGLMPNPEDGTITDNISEAIAKLKQKRVEYKADKTGVVHIQFGKFNFANEDLMENLIAVVASIEANKPPGVTGKYWKSAHISTSFGLSVKLNINEMLLTTLTYTHSGRDAVFF